MDKKVTIKQLQEVIGKGRTTIWQYMGYGMPHYKEGRYVYFDVDEVKDWLNVRGKGVDAELYASAIKSFGDDKLSLVDFIRKNADGKTYLAGSLDAIRGIFEPDRVKISGKYSISGRTIYLLVRLADAIFNNKDIDFSLWAGMLEESIKEIIVEVMHKKYKIRTFTTFFREHNRTLERFIGLDEFIEKQECMGTFFMIPQNLNREE